jgi:hypothetical protein
MTGPGPRRTHNGGGAVCFLWHFPSGDPICESMGALPDVIRHTALRSSDFPLPALARRERPSGPAAYVFYYIWPRSWTAASGIEFLAHERAIEPLTPRAQKALSRHKAR